MADRQIGKFRGKRLDGKWVYGYYCCWQTRHYIAQFPHESGFSGGDIISYKIAGWYEVDPATVGEFIGQLNKNKKEIYQHDWLGHPFEGYIDWCDNCKQFQLFWPDLGCAACDGNVNWYELINNFDLEVIGNIHENSELIEKFYKQGPAE